MRLIIALTSLFFSHDIIAQSPYAYTDSSGTVTVRKDMRLDILSTKQIEINKRASKMSSSGYYRGYRIQVYNGQSRDEANTVKAELLRRFPDQKAYLLYQAPNFRVRVGNFLTQKEGADLRKIISALYPQRGIYIIPDLIEYTPPDEEETE